MKLENQVCSLELARKLKDLGVKQGSAFYVCVQEYSQFHLEENRHETVQIGTLIYTDPNGELEASGKAIHCYTVAELGEMLPEGSASYRRIIEKWSCIPPREMQGIATKTTSDTEADARAKMLIYLLENKLITL